MHEGITTEAQLLLC